MKIIPILKIYDPKPRVQGYKTSPEQHPTFSYECACGANHKEEVVWPIAHSESRLAQEP